MKIMPDKIASGLTYCTSEGLVCKATIDQLHDDVATGKRRLQFNARCTTVNTTDTASLDDAASPNLLTPLNEIIGSSKSDKNIRKSDDWIAIVNSKKVPFIIKVKQA